MSLAATEIDPRAGTAPRASATINLVDSRALTTTSIRTTPPGQLPLPAPTGAACWRVPQPVKSACPHQGARTSPTAGTTRSLSPRLTC